MKPDYPAPARPDLDRLMDDHGDSILRLCCLYLKDHQLAEDATQEAFLRAYVKYGDFRGDSTEKTWLTRIAINICKDAMRKRSYRDRPDGGEPSDPGMVPSAEQAALDHARSLALYNAVLALEPIYREVILLFYYQQLKISEVALALETREGTVKSRLTRARTQLGQMLGEEF